MSVQVAADLRAAAEVLRRDGWTRGAYKDACGRCVAGALMFAATDGAGSSPRFLETAAWARLRVARDALEEVIGTGSPARYNDAPDRTADEVIAALEAAAERAEADQ